jgi:hypothetical protein
MMNERRCHLLCKREYTTGRSSSFETPMYSTLLHIFSFPLDNLLWIMKTCIKIPTNMHTKKIMWTRVGFVCVYLNHPCWKHVAKFKLKSFKSLALWKRKRDWNISFHHVVIDKKKGLFSISQSLFCAWVAKQWFHWHGRGALSIIYWGSRPRVEAYSVHAMDTNKIETSTYRWMWYQLYEQCGSRWGLLMQVWCCLLF